MEKVLKYDLNESIDEITSEIIKNKNELALLSFELKQEDTTCTIKLSHRYEGVYGLGERFNRVNQKGCTVKTEITEEFCNQGDVSYCPVPFFFTDHNLGVLIDTFTVTEFVFEEDIKIRINRDSKARLPVIYFFYGEPKDIIRNYSRITGRPTMIPKWSFGPWMSANRWNTEDEIRHQIEEIKNHRVPHSVMVIEAWSDEATFYRFNDHGEWKDPKEMIKVMKENDLHLILWQIPVIKKMENDERHEHLDRDWEYAIKHKLCLLNSDGSPYTIPEGHWFAGSLLPDFTNEETLKWWFDKRQYLLEMGVEGFKTDGGEFVLRDDVIAANGFTGLEQRNQYALSYVEAYSRFVGKNRVLFSRAGYTGQQKFPIQWAGDQMSTWEEFRHILAAGLSIGLSGVPFWSFDIGGFAGALPGLELYERATQLSVFTPVMQWHSEPVGGQFADILSSGQSVNDRSPWNISRVYNDEAALDRLRFQYNLRMNLLPYLYQLALNSSKTGLPMMRHFILEYPKDQRVKDIEDSYMLGDILVAPIMEEGITQRCVYLPEGTWRVLWPMAICALDHKEEGSKDDFKSNRVDPALKLKGGTKYLVSSGMERIPVFVRDGSCIVLNLDHTLELGSDVGNKTGEYINLCFYITGEEGEYHYSDDENHEILIKWENGSYNIKRILGDANLKVIYNK